MDFPAWPPTELDARSATSTALGVPVDWTGEAHDGFFLLALLADERAVRDLVPDLSAIGGLDFSAIIVTAVAEPTQSHNFVSRLFAPKVGIPEDPVTGSSHTVLGPFWADRLGRGSLVGLQASSRPGRVGVEVVGDRVTITGRAITVLNGQLTAPAQPT
jgi:PhzF family phenazine biosynthesis protein